MPKQGCVTHKLTTFMQIRSDYLDLFEGDHCAAILLWIFEYQTDHEIGRLELAKENGAPWIKISVDQLEGEFLGLFRESAIKDRLALFREYQLIQVESGKGGRASQYLLDCNTVSELLQSRKHITVDHDRPEAARRPQQKSEPEAAAEVAGRPHIREEELRSKNNTPVAPSSPLANEEENAEGTLEVLSRLRREAEHCGRLKAAESAALEEWLPSALGRYESGQITAAFEAFLADEYWKPKKFPIRAFMSQLSRYVERNGAERTPAPRLAIAEAVPTPNSLPVASTQPAVCNPRETANEIAAKWNQLVPSAPVALPLHATAATRLQSLLNVSEFADSFGVMAEKAEKIKAARGDDADWMDFHWLIRKAKNGEVENWQKLLSGEFNWMSNKRKSKGRDSPGDVVSRAIAALHEKKGISPVAEK